MCLLRLIITNIIITIYVGKQRVRHIYQYIKQKHLLLLQFKQVVIRYQLL